MIKTALSALAIVLSVVVAHSQSAVNPASSDVDVKSSRYGSPGTIGAMDAVAASIATSADDVVLQQRGHGTAAQGAHQRPERTGVEAVGYAPGTVGATPGY